MFERSPADKKQGGVIDAGSAANLDWMAKGFVEKIGKRKDVWNRNCVIVSFQACVENLVMCIVPGFGFRAWRVSVRNCEKRQ